MVTSDFILHSLTERVWILGSCSAGEVITTGQQHNIEGAGSETTAGQSELPSEAAAAVEPQQKKKKTPAAGSETTAGRSKLPSEAAAAVEPQQKKNKAPAAVRKSLRKPVPSRTVSKSEGTGK